MSTKTFSFDNIRQRWFDFWKLKLVTQFQCPFRNNFLSFQKQFPAFLTKYKIDNKCGCWKNGRPPQCACVFLSKALVRYNFRCYSVQNTCHVIVFEGVKNNSNNIIDVNPRKILFAAPYYAWEKKITLFQTPFRLVTEWSLMFLVTFKNKHSFIQPYCRQILYLKASCFLLSFNIEASSLVIRLRFSSSFHSLVVP